MTEIIKHTYMLRRGTADEWMRVNPLLNIGEPGFEIDTNRLKIGNGFEDWLSLPYINNTITIVEELPEFGTIDIIYMYNNQLWIWNIEWICLTAPASYDIAQLTQNTEEVIIFDCGTVE